MRLTAESETSRIAREAEIKRRLEADAEEIPIEAILSRHAEDVLDRRENVYRFKLTRRRMIIGGIAACVVLAILAGIKFL